MSDMHYTVVALGSMDMSISLVLKLHHSIWKHITDNISIFHIWCPFANGNVLLVNLDNKSQLNIMFMNLYIRISYNTFGNDTTAAKNILLTHKTTMHMIRQNTVDL